MSKIIFFIAIVVFIVGGSLFWQDQSEKAQDKLDNESQLSYISANGEVILAYPTEWQATENSGDLLDDGLYTLELESPGNDIATAAVKERFDFDLRNISEAATDGEFVDALSSPQADLFALLEVNTASANNYELFDSLEEWFDDYLDDLDTTSGVSVSQPEPFEIKQGEAIQFYTSIVEGDTTVRTWHVFALGVAAQVEAVLYPADNAQFEAAQEIMSSLFITEILLNP